MALFLNTSKGLWKSPKKQVDFEKILRLIFSNCTPLNSTLASISSWVLHCLKIPSLFSVFNRDDRNKSITLFLPFSLLPYSEPDQDLSPNNDPDWDWGEGGNKDAQEKEEARQKTEEKKNVLSEAVLTDTNNVISK